MISPKVAKLMDVLPQGIITAIAKKLTKMYLKKYADITVYGRENLENIKTPTIFICNHLSNSDGVILNEVLSHIEPTFVAGVKLSKDAVTKIGSSICKSTPIKPNSPDKEGLKKIIELVKKGESIAIFPEGTRSRDKKMIEAKKGILLIAKMANVPIVPMGIWGTEQLLPINEDGDMSSEKFNYAKVGVKIGKQMELPKKNEGEGKKEYEERTMLCLMKSIAELLPENYRGYYGDKQENLIKE